MFVSSAGKEMENYLLDPNLGQSLQLANYCTTLVYKMDMKYTFLASKMIKKWFCRPGKLLKKLW